MRGAKPFEIPKAVVWRAYERVKTRGSATGVDSQSMEDFEEHLKGNLYRIWNRMSSGTYFPPPVRQVAIPKRGGGERRLGIPTVADRIAQTVAKILLEPEVEPTFHPDSYGYRPGKSAIQAVGKARARCWRYDWVVDLDVRAFFDTLDHDLVMHAVRRYTSCRWILLYIERWLKTPVQVEDGSMVARTTGTPQGGVISPLLANIFLHLAFDTWMTKTYPMVPFERYADDIILHCTSKAQAELIMLEVRKRLARCKLGLHPNKTKIVYCKDGKRRGSHVNESFDFLGFTFRPRRARDRKGEYFVSFSPGTSREAAKTMRQTTRSWRLHRRSDKELLDLARMFDPVVRGWINYFGSYRKSALYPVLKHLNRTLVRWAMRKYKRLRGHRKRACKWLENVARRDPSLFAHWRLLGVITSDGW